MMYPVKIHDPLISSVILKTVLPACHPSDLVVSLFRWHFSCVLDIPTFKSAAKVGAGLSEVAFSVKWL